MFPDSPTFACLAILTLSMGYLLPVVCCWLVFKGKKTAALVALFPATCAAIVLFQYHAGPILLYWSLAVLILVLTIRKKSSQVPQTNCEEAEQDPRATTGNSGPDRV